MPADRGGPIPAPPATPTLAGDLWGGLAAMLVALPAAIAFGVLILTAIDPALAPTGAAAGALGAGMLGLVSPWVGRNGGMVTGPCAPAAALTSALAGSLAAAGHPVEHILPLLALTAVLSGALQVVYGLVGIGRLMKYLPYQVVSGFLSGIAVLIATSQLPKLLGLRGGLGAVAEVSSWRWEAMAVGGATILAVALGPRLTSRIPGPVLALAAGSACYLALALVLPELRTLEANGLVIGSLSGVPPVDYVTSRVTSLATLRPSDLALVAGAAAALSALLSIDTLKTAVVLDVLTRTRHDSGRELVAQGVANIASAVVGGIPGGGTMGPTLLNVTSGGRSPWSGFAEGAMALVAFLVLSPLLAWLPVSALAGLLMVVAVQMFDWHSLRLATRPNTRFDFGIIAVVVAAAVGVGLIEATVVGTVLAILLFIRDVANNSVIRSRRDLTHTASKLQRSPEARAILDAFGSEALVVELTGDLFFGTTDQLVTELQSELASCRDILLDLRRVQAVDYSAGRLLRQMHEQLAERGGRLLLCGMPARDEDVSDYLEELGLVGDGGIPVFPTRDAAVESMEDHLLADHGTDAGTGTDADPLELREMRLFAGLDDDALAVVATVVERVDLDAGEQLFKRKDRGTDMFLVAAGKVDIVLPLKGGAFHHVATIARGDHFGEMSFVERRKRTATVTARTPCVLYALDRGPFDAATADHPEIGRVVYANVAASLSHHLRKANKELRALEDR